MGNCAYMLNKASVCYSLSCLHCLRELLKQIWIFESNWLCHRGCFRTNADKSKAFIASEET